ncbi:uncharacterized protein VTP21DRAFT_6345 [Calcarisporiella thermophila]|uniref:uncharacterized protein n=1 Tax=Calcarisporiella thermophila TaxID=911321 RepID=UPI0037420FF3
MTSSSTDSLPHSSLKIHCTSTFLSNLLYDCSNSSGDCEGFITGSFLKQKQQHVDDFSDTVRVTHEIHLMLKGSFMLPLEIPKFYDAVGNVNHEMVKSLVPETDFIVGYVKFRRQTELRPTLREERIARQLAARFGRKCFVFMLCQGNATPTRATHRYAYGFWRVPREDSRGRVRGEEEERFEKVDVKVENMKENSQEQYAEFMPRLAFEDAKSSTAKMVRNALDALDERFIVKQYETMLHKMFMGLKHTSDQMSKSEQELYELRKMVRDLALQVSGAPSNRLPLDMPSIKGENGRADSNKEEVSLL